MIPIESLSTGDSSKRLSRESFWIKKLKTLTPGGLNQKESNSGPLPLVLPYSARGIKLGREIKSAYQELLEVFPPLHVGELLCAFTKNKNLKDILVQTKFKE